MERNLFKRRNLKAVAALIALLTCQLITFRFTSQCQEGSSLPFQLFNLKPFFCEVSNRPRMKWNWRTSIGLRFKGDVPRFAIGQCQL